MAVNVEIRQRGLFGTLPEVKDILLENMGYGIMDEAYRLTEGETGECTVMYDLMEIGRGFEVTYEKKSLWLRLPLPGSEEDIRTFYRLVRHVCRLMGVKSYYRDEEKVDCGDSELIERQIELDMKVSVDALAQIKEELGAGKYESLYLFGARNPIAIGKREIEEIGGDLTQFGKFLREKQQMDVFYAKAKVYQKKDGTIFGVYVVPADVPTVLPRKASLFMNEEIKVEEWYVFLAGELKKPGAVDFDVFWKECWEGGSLQYYDGEHDIVTMPAALMEKMLDSYRADV